MELVILLGSNPVVDLHITQKKSKSHPHRSRAMATTSMARICPEGETEKNSPVRTPELSEDSSSVEMKEETQTNSSSREDDLAQTMEEWENEETEADEIAPKEFICPLTLAVMVDPVLTRHGHNFERDSILKWIARDTGLCPITRKPLRISDVITNHHLRSRIHRWRRENDFNVRIIVDSDEFHKIFGYLQYPDEARDGAEHPRDDPIQIAEVPRRRRRGLLGRIFHRAQRS